jgi:murein DD-endopeptidase MepM/ murein hydrolase activator NlpD/lysophospholipase L1-like esterase
MLKEFHNKLFAIITLVVFCASSMTATAMSPEQKSLYRKNILYYDLACAGVEDSIEASGSIENLYMVGDSITEGAEKDLDDEFTKKGVKNALINASVGRSITGKGTTQDQTSGLQAIDNDKNKPGLKNANVVVVALGTNQNNDFAGTMKDMIDKIKATNSEARIYWVNIFSSIPGRGDVNNTIQEVASKNGARVIDTDNAGIEISPTDPQRLHPSPAGNKKFAQTVAKSLDTSNPASDESGLGELRQLDLAAVANVNGLHSAAVRELGGKDQASYKANEVPGSVASTIKLIIADAFLDANPNLDKKITIKDEHLYGGGTPQGTPWDPNAGQTFTLRQSLQHALQKSSNVQANVLIDEAGGPDKITETAQRLGYSSTEITSYFKSSGSSKPRKSTAGDLTNAMNAIFTKKDANYKVAQSALQDSTYKFGLNSTANKWGGNNDFTGNVGIFSSGDKKFIITVLTEEKWQDEVLPDFPGTRGTTPSQSVSKIKEATNKIVQDLKGPPKEARQGCSCPATQLEGENNAIKVYNYLVNEMDLTPAQVAGIIGNTMNESGGNTYKLDPTVRGVGMCSPDCMGIVQWDESSRFAALKAWAQPLGKDPLDLETQAEYIKVELEGPESVALGKLKEVKGDDEAAAREAALVFDKWYERSSAGQQEREDNAARFFKEYVKGGGVTGGDPDSNSTCAGGSGTAKGNFIWPVDKQYGFTGCWNEFRSYYNGGAGGGHSGIDIGAPRGSKIVAADGGTVELARNSDPGGFGVAVIIKHGNGFWTLYAHMIEGSVAVRQGEKVDQGQKLGEVNNTGSSRGDHLHFNIQGQGGEQGTSANTTNPLDHLPDDGRANSAGCIKGPKGGPSGYSGQTGYNKL